MKNVIGIVAIVAASMFLASCEDGSYFDSNTTQLKSDAVGRIETVGEDMRVYEFTPQTDSNVQCVFVAGTQKGGLQCWTKHVQDDRHPD